MINFEMKQGSWKQAVAQYQHPDNRLSVWQLLTTISLYFVALYLMFRSLEVSYLLTLLLALPAGGLLMRVFILFHDAGHGSLFESSQLNDLVGWVTGILTFTPYHYWRHTHAMHHATSGDLDRRGTGDIWMLTVEEYQNLSPRKRLWYRIYRSPWVLFFLGPPVLFVVIRRFPDTSFKAREISSVYWTNLGVLAMVAGMSALFGFWQYIVVQLPVIWIASSFGVWLFYIQHQYDGVYWVRHEDWSFERAALEGSSFYKLPRMLQWFTGNIGFHHIHHLRPRIPNYQLEAAYRAIPEFQEAEPVKWWSSWKAARLTLWDEEHRRMVSFGDISRRKG